MYSVILLRTLSLLSFVLGSSLAYADSPVAWRLSGYFHTSPKEKSYLTIVSGRIACVDRSRRAENCLEGVDKEALSQLPVLETEAFVFPGLMDLHNHIEFNSLPLWKEAKGQFENRFQWRQIEGYQNGPHKFFMRAMKERQQFACLSLQWSELKALTGGVTVIQGMGRRENEECARDFGIRNVEIRESMEMKETISGAMEILNPDYMIRGYEAFIAPRLSSKNSYEQVLQNLKQEYGIDEWLRRFTQEDHSLENGIRLTVGPLSEPYLSSLQQPLTIETLPGFLRLFLSKEEFDKVYGWLVGSKIGGISYVDITPQTPEIEILAAQFLCPNKFDRTARDFDAVLHIPRDFREYLVEFVNGDLKRIKGRLTQNGMLAYFTHLSEGRRDEGYNSKEYKYAAQMGILFPSLVAIHGVGMSKEDFADAAKRGVGVVWSPTSNLLLYGESIRIKEALAAKTLLSLGSDWSMTGSKTILEELRMARDYAKKEKAKLSTNKIVEMVTTNSAKMIKLDRIGGLGRIELGYQADLTLISRSNQKGAASKLVNATQEEVQLVVVRGEPMYGEADLLTKAAIAVGDNQSPESLEMNKAARLLNWSDRTKRFSYAKLKAELEAEMARTSQDYRALFGGDGLTLDPLF